MKDVRKTILSMLVYGLVMMTLIIQSYYNGYEDGKRHGEVRTVYVEVEKKEVKPLINFAKEGLKTLKNDVPEETEELETTETPSTEPLSVAVQEPIPVETPAAPEVVKVVSSNQTNLVSLGIFTESAYCICYKCCGKTPEHPQYGLTATGTRATPGRTIAVDPSVIPLGSEVIVNGCTYIAEDTGSHIRGKRIDLCVSSHAEGLQHGLKQVEVFLVKK